MFANSACGYNNRLAYMKIRQGRFVCLVLQLSDVSDESYGTNGNYGT